MKMKVFCLLKIFRALGEHSPWERMFSGASVAVVLLMSIGHQCQAQDPIRLEVGDTFQDSVDVYPKGTSFLIAAGRHYGQMVIPRQGMTFSGEDGAELVGSVVLEDWEKQGDYWVHDSVYMTGNDIVSHCDDDEPVCGYTNDIYLDDSLLLKQVDSLAGVSAGIFYLDYENGIVYLFDDPTFRKVEICSEPFAFFSSAEGVTVENLTIRKYATEAQTGAIQAGDDDSLASSWTIRGCKLFRNHGTAIKAFGPGHIIERNLVHRNGQMGISIAKSRGSLVRGNDISENRTIGFHIFWEGGGAKFVRCTTLVVDSNIVVGNDGVGLWTDIDNNDIHIENNLVELNANIGIFHELSDSAVIRYNVVRGNALDNWVGWLYGGQICVSSSNSAEVAYNYVEVFPVPGPKPANGITVYNQPLRQAPARGKDSQVHHNTIVLHTTEAICGIGDDENEAEFVATYNNRFDFNRYYVPPLGPDNRGRHWHWEGDGWTFNRLQTEAGQELHGTVTYNLSGPFDVPQGCDLGQISSVKPGMEDHALRGRIALPFVAADARVYSLLGRQIAGGDRINSAKGLARGFYLYASRGDSYLRFRTQRVVHFGNSQQGFQN